MLGLGLGFKIKPMHVSCGSHHMAIIRSCLGVRVRVKTSFRVRLRVKTRFRVKTRIMD